MSRRPAHYCSGKDLVSFLYTAGSTITYIFYINMLHDWNIDAVFFTIRGLLSLLCLPSSYLNCSIPLRAVRCFYQMLYPALFLSRSNTAHLCNVHHSERCSVHSSSTLCLCSKHSSDIPSLASLSLRGSTGLHLVHSFLSSWAVGSGLFCTNRAPYC